MTVPLCGRGWRDLLAAHLQIPLAHPPRVVARVTPQGFVVRVTNVGKTPLLYYGYASDQPQELRDAWLGNHWREDGWNWCCTGMVSFTIAPDNSVEFRFSATGLPGKRRIHTVFSTLDGKQQSLVLLAETK